MVKQFKYSEDMLKMPELDAVMIGTGDFQHVKLLAEVVKAGKLLIFIKKKYIYDQNIC